MESDWKDSLSVDNKGNLTKSISNYRAIASGDKEKVETITNGWIIEISELNGMKRANDAEANTVQLNHSSIHNDPILDDIVSIWSAWCQEPTLVGASQCMLPIRKVHIPNLYPTVSLRCCPTWFVPDRL